MTDKSVEVAEKRPRGNPNWVKGKSGNPHGRPKGTRDAITKAFIEDLCADWVEHGKATLETVREKDPTNYVRIVASLVPRNDKIEVSVSDEAAERIRMANERFMRMRKGFGNGQDEEEVIVDG